MAFEQVRAYGKKEQEIVISIKVSIKAIKNGVMVYLHGQTATFTKEAIKAI